MVTVAPIGRVYVGGAGKRTVRRWHAQAHCLLGGAGGVEAALIHHAVAVQTVLAQLLGCT